ncbi:MAG: hypothetical protein LC772_02140 [Chloroflexi bacterium]|nr:hypothetical protein [Chloroflexota bacterium]
MINVTRTAAAVCGLCLFSSAALQAATSSHSRKHYRHAAHKTVVHARAVSHGRAHVATMTTVTRHNGGATTTRTVVKTGAPATKVAVLNVSGMT